MRNTKKRPISERFWEKVEAGNKAECWEWRGSKDRHGYGKINTSSPDVKTVYAHRLSYLMENGHLQDEEVVMHTCDNPSCVNPAHLIAGTQSENIRDAIQKGRKTYLSQRSLCALQAEKVKSLISSGTNRHAIADAFGVSIHVINDVARGKTYQQTEQAHV